MNKSNYNKQYEKDYAEIIKENEALQAKHKEDKKKIKQQDNIIASNAIILGKMDIILEECSIMKKQIETMSEIIKKQNEEIERLKNNNKKDSSNSSKPSSTNGSKTIPNTREKSNKKQGGQIGHKANVLKNVDSLLKSNNVTVKENYIENPTKKVPKYIIDIKTVIEITHNKVDEKYYDNINPVQYGENLKSNVAILSFDNYMSTDGIVKYISSITEGFINISKGTVCNWIKEFSDNLDDELNVITNGLLDSYYINVDDSQQKINGQNYNQLCMCNDRFVFLTPSKKKNYEAWSNTLLKNYFGVVIKDGADIFDSFGRKQGQCVSHIIRYLKSAVDLNHSHSANRMKSLLSKINRLRNKLISNNKTSFGDQTINYIVSKYDKIIKDWEIELKPNKDSIAHLEEKRLLNRMKNKDKDQILEFIRDFKIPSTNNNAESSQRGLKIKQKIGKFRSEVGSLFYCRAKSFILTLKKQNKSIMGGIRSVFSKTPVLY